MMDWAKLLTAAFSGIGPMLPPVIGIFALIYALVLPIPGRGPRILQKQDPWRRFKGDARRQIMARAGNRCEGARFLSWRRCPDPATEADHVYPWSRYGPTTPSNGQALCSGHNRSKGAMRPPWWYLLALEHRRRSYFPPDADVRVQARMRNAELATHLTRRQ
ncbi:HNH endonuclease [Propionicimonas sp.]|uniref:HNH endonuclease n=1 Tax=Propionicimonas sp. TaxID=1955623 RepID=UPI00179F9BD4|nr:HNH endonuclease [Propionicimonas sp.]MBU3975913.1 HNH endonuclease [Actinomycetota bacterium]MBA3020730.1 HNH endonuclease [Propionicimonas sp.]MBU3985103.1 HNH endonuclease [Actinomycetota bacterium]MBU4008093.1 HNH endonuclease [Actinomycetota bacterium]MBU4064693.1 HNH endonuclease [Actinomycetota bacterium]